MTETINITVDSEDLKELKETTGMSISECIKNIDEQRKIRRKNGATRLDRGLIMNIYWDEKAWQECLYWQMQDKKTLKRI